MHRGGGGRRGGSLGSPELRPISPWPCLTRRSDASLYCDDVDIRFSKTMNSCKVLQVRYASVGRLLERLTDLRFLSIDFLNTFLHSYRVFTTAVVVLDKLVTIYRKPISAIPARCTPPPRRAREGGQAWRQGTVEVTCQGTWGISRGPGD